MAKASRIAARQAQAMEEIGQQLEELEKRVKRMEGKINFIVKTIKDSQADAEPAEAQADAE